MSSQTSPVLSSASAESLVVVPNRAMFQGQHYSQESEDERAKVVIVCDPGMPSFIAGLHPAASLYENPLNLEKARCQHEKMRNAIKKLGATVLTVNEILSMMELQTLRELAQLRLKYQYDGPSPPPKELTDYLSDQYKQSVVNAMAKDQLVTSVMLCPIVTLMGQELIPRYSFEPMGNTVFTRDQQVCLFMFTQKEKKILFTILN
jgi:arginine deiminase